MTVMHFHTGHLLVACMHRFTRRPSIHRLPITFQYKLLTNPIRTLLSYRPEALRHLLTGVSEVLRDGRRNPGNGLLG